MASVQYVVELLEKTTAFDDLERSYWKELLPSMTRPQMGKFARIMQDHEDALERLRKKHGHREIQDWEQHIKAGWATINALKQGCAL